MTVFEGLMLAASGLAAGAINAVAGGGTLLSFPALIGLGRDSIVANATSTVALLPGALTSIWGYRTELKSGSAWVRVLLLPSLLGGVLGAYLLLRTPSSVFSAIVPFLILGATLLRAVHYFLPKRAEVIPGETHQNLWGAQLFQFGVAIYGGYFGAGIGILMLAAFGLLGMRDIHQMNGLKVLLGLAINGIAAGYFLFSGKVNWGDALVMAVGAAVGGYIGAHFAKKIGRSVTNALVLVIGTLMGVALLWKRFL
jgi:uncharacterized membrane protein YfcA